MGGLKRRWKTKRDLLYDGSNHPYISRYLEGRKIELHESYVGSYTSVIYNRIFFRLKSIEVIVDYWEE